MKIGLIGLGKLGYPMSLFLSTKFEVRCYDKNKKIIDKLLKQRNNDYLSNEENLTKYLKKKRNIGFFYNLEETLHNTDACFITVPTPSKKNGSFSNKILFGCFDQIARIIKKNKVKKPYLINICSTVSPGSCNEEFVKNLKKNNLNLNKDFLITYNPYFVALGSVLKTLIKPDYVLIGSCSLKAEKIIKKIYTKIYPKSIKLFLLGLEEAELVKIFTNSFLTLKISFGNLIKIIAIKKNLALDNIMNALGSDTRIGKKFLNPGLPFAGPCLPRDNYAVAEYLGRNGVSNKFSKEIIDINNSSIKLLYKEIDHLIKLNFRKIGFFGAGYKPYTESLDESIAVKIINYCLKKKMQVFLLDHYTDYSKNGVKNCLNLKNLLHNSEIIFLPFIDKKFDEILKFSHKKIIWDPFYFLKSKKHQIVRSCLEIKKT